MAENRVPRVSVPAPSGGRVLVKQSHALASDVNAIVARHVAHGIAFPVNERASYGDFTGVGEFHGALNAVREAQAEFDRLPAAIREHCRNDPGEFLSMVYDPDRQAELVELGLVEAAIPAAAVPAVPEVAPVVP